MTRIVFTSKSQEKRIARQKAPREKVNPTYTWRATPCKKCGRVYCPCTSEKKEEK